MRRRCHAESNFAKIILGTRSELGLGSAEHAPKMIDVLDKQPVTLTSAPTPNAFKAQFEETVEGSEERAIAFTGKGDEEKVARAHGCPIDCAVGFSTTPSPPSTRTSPRSCWSGSSGRAAF